MDKKIFSILPKYIKPFSFILFTGFIFNIIKIVENGFGISPFILIFPMASFRIILTLSIGITVGLLAGMKFIQRIYLLSNSRDSFYYLISSVFDIFLPHIIIVRGRIQTKNFGSNILQQVGGPGIINVDLKSIVLVENLSNDLKVFTEGEHYIKKFEAIKELVTSL